ncbi:MAG: alpha-amylase family glycosyl hydrolase [Bacteroidota bacterium]
MKYIRLLAVVFFVIVVSCSVDKKVENGGTEIIGDASPVYLKFQEDNQIVLSDYFLNTDKIDSLVIPSELKYHWSKENGIVNVKGFLKSPFSNMSVYVLDEKYDLPIKSIIKDTYIFKFNANGKRYNNLKIKGTFNNWDTENNPLKLDNGIYTTELELLPGVYQYVLVEGEEEFPNPEAEEKVSNGIGGFNSVLKYGDDTADKAFLWSKLKGDEIEVSSNTDLNVLVYLSNKLILRSDLKEGGNLIIDIPEWSKNIDRSDLHIYAFNNNISSNDLLIPLKNGQPITDSKTLTRHDFHSQIMYEVMVDRFNNGSEENDSPLNQEEVKPIADYMGGDLKGITKKIQEGFFRELGINTLWLTPIVQNPFDAWGEWNEGGVYSRFSGYHGYWPLETTKIDVRFGTPAELDELLDVAHENNMNIVLDYVANHVHQDAQLIKDNPDWKTPLELPDGTLNLEKWDSQRLTTWFDKFLPTLDLENQEVTEVMTDTAMFWLKRYDLDGLRHDACKHIPLNYWRTLTKKVKNEVIVKDNRPIYQVGETYSGPELIGSYVNSGMLNGQFDFNLYDQSVRSFAIGDEGFQTLKSRLEESLTYYGSHHLMGNISGNHDRARVISYVDGSVDFEEDTKLAGWTREINNKGNKGFDIVGQIIAFAAVIPGVPVIYYGDEIAMPGGNDPDNRRMMQFDNLSAEKQNLRNKTGKILKFRRNNMSLLYGDTKVLEANDDVLIILRTYLGENTIAIFNKSNKDNIEFSLPDYVEGELESLFGNDFTNKGNGISIQLPKGGVELIYSKYN